jgi:predicted Zn-dependent peptidase
VLARYRDEAERLAKAGIDKTFFDRQKKAMTGRQIRSLNSMDSICHNTARGYFRGFDAFEAVELLNAVTTDDVSAFVRDNLSPDKMAVSVIKPCQPAC